MSTIADLKQQQIKIHDAAFANPAVTTGQANLIISYLAQKPITTALNMLNTSLSGARILCICAGTGEEAIRLQSLGASVTATDISEAACKLITKKNPLIKTEIQDAEHLAYSNDSFDYVVVKHGLHHLPRPILGLYEMLRVAKRGIIVIEAQDTILMSILIKLHLTEKIEESGNYVYRFSRREIKKILSSLFISKYSLHTEWYQYVPWFNKHVYPYLNNKLGFIIFKFLLAIFNLFFGYWGNNFILIVEK